MPEACSERVREAGSWPRYHQCERSAVVTRDGKPYCTRHDPERRRARQETANTKYQADLDYRRLRAELVWATIAFVREDRPMREGLADEMADAHDKCVELGLNLSRLY